MLRLGLHLGLRQKNLRELLLCPKGRRPAPERKLEALRCGELRWTGASWEVLIPAAAFKNANSSFFDGRPFRVTLPDIGDLYALIDMWIARHRPVLIGRAVDPGTVLVATARGPKTNISFGKAAFYNLWRQTIARYGVFNPYTGRGAPWVAASRTAWRSGRPGHSHFEGDRLLRARRLRHPGHGRDRRPPLRPLSA